MIKKEEFIGIYNIVEQETEFEIYMEEKEETYMIIKYSNEKVYFQKCRKLEENYEKEYKNIKELLESKQIDNIILDRDWEKIKDIIVNATFSMKNEKEKILEIYTKEKN